MPQGPDIHANASAEVKAAIEELLLLYRVSQHGNHSARYENINNFLPGGEAQAATQMPQAHATTTPTTL